MSTFSNNMKFYRNKLLMTQEDLAKKIKLSQSMVTQMENGQKDPSLKTIERIAKAFKVPTHIMLMPHTHFQSRK